MKKFFVHSALFLGLTLTALSFSSVLFGKGEAIKVPIGSLIRCDGTLFYLGTQRERLFIEDTLIAASWNLNIKNIPTLSQEECLQYNESYTVPFKPGSVVLYRTQLNKYYAISSPDTLRELPNSQIANAIFGSSWNQLGEMGLLRTLPESSIDTYALGDPIYHAGDYNRQAELNRYASIDELFGFEEVPALSVTNLLQPTLVQDGAEYFRDIRYASVQGQNLELDVIRPQNKKGPFPVVIHVPGGFADKSHGYSLVSPLVSAGYAFVPISREVAKMPKNLFLHDIHLLKATIRWVRANAPQYNLDPNRIALFGFSAGTYVSGFAGVTGDDPAWEGTLGNHLDTSTKVQAVIGMSGVYNLEVNPLDCDEPYEQKPWGGTYQQCVDGSKIDSYSYAGCDEYDACLDRIRSYSSINHVSKDDPPFLMTVGGKNDQIPFGQPQRMRDALRAVGVAAEFYDFKNYGHETSPFLDQSELFITFLDKFLK